MVPSSGGKDSAFAAHVLKYKYKMNPLTITWAPHMYTAAGLKNMDTEADRDGPLNWLAND